MGNKHYYVKDPETEIIYRTVGYTYQENLIVYPKYVLDTNGKRGQLSTKYKGVNYPDGSVKFLATRKVFISDNVNIKLNPTFHSFLPMAKKQNLKLYDPYTEMITRFHANDSLSIKMRQLVQLLSKKTSVPIKYFGLDASMLAAMDQKKSDIDLVVYGKKNAWLVRKAYENLIEDNNSKITSPLKMAKTIIKRRRSYSPLMTCKEILEWEMSKISGYFMKTKFSVMPININGKYKTKYIPTNQFGAIRVKLKDSEIVCDPGITDLSRHEVSIIYGPDNITINQYITFLPSRMGIFLKKGDTLFIIGKIYKTTSNNSTFALTQFPWDDSDSTGRSYFVTKKEMTNLQHLIPSLFGLNLNSNCYTDK